MRPSNFIQLLFLASFILNPEGISHRDLTHSDKSEGT